MFAACTLQAQEVNDRYIEVTGTSEIEIVPDKIHYLIEIREYFEVPCKCGLKSQIEWFVILLCGCLAIRPELYFHGRVLLVGR